jgi:hypothetical protein
VNKFFGSDLDLQQCEELSLQAVSEDIRSAEADLFDTKWFDYRMWHPVQATYYWAHCYVQASKTFCARTFDQEKAASVQGLIAPNIFATREASAAIVARQHLDRVGCRYEWAMTFIINRFMDRGWVSLPRPNQLYGEELIWDIADAWKVECAASMQLPAHPHYKEDGECLLRSKYWDFAEQQVRKRGVEHWRSLSRLLAEGVMPVHEAEKRFGVATTSRALKVCGK